MDVRFRRHWERWQRLREAGENLQDILPTASDQTLVELLAYREGGTGVERNIIATELLNRLLRLHSRVERHTERVNDLLDQGERHRVEDEAREQAAHEGAASSRARAREASATMREDARSLEEQARRTSRYSRRSDRLGGW